MEAKSDLNCKAFEPLRKRNKKLKEKMNAKVNCCLIEKNSPLTKVKATTLLGKSKPAPKAQAAVK